ncbi:hypothetical protein [Prosthecobacter sp.]|uniref:hypothetical protein n=1 Tax=Prosthecobacter sp. TaxID=1965333 RepID=UPI003783AFF9
MRFAALISAVAIVGGNARALPAWAENTANNGAVESWVNGWQEEVCSQAMPIPMLLFSRPLTKLRNDTWNLSWLSGAQLKPLQERLNPDARLIDLSNQTMVRDPIFWELVTTDGLIVDITARPKDPIPGGHIIYSINCEPRWETFWLRRQPVPSALRSMAFTWELLQEDDRVSTHAIRGVCSSI